MYYLLINIEVFHTSLVNIIMLGSNALRIGCPVIIHVLYDFNQFGTLT